MSKETEKDTELEKEENTSAESEEVKEAADTAENATEDTEKKAEESETEKLKKELAEANDKYLRLMAEYDNFRKRSAKERLELTDTAKGNVINGFLPVSIKMAKTQNLSLNPTKISGTCGRLMCCLKYEQNAERFIPTSAAISFKEMAWT